MYSKKSENCAELTILPVSGGHFINQVALIALLCEHNYRPKLLLGSSGGTIAAYIGLCGNWTSNGIIRVMRELDSKLFAASWWGDTLGKYLPSAAIGIFKGALYNHGSGSSQFLANYLTTDSITRCEIWCGTYNKDTGIAAMFCNRQREDSYIKSGDDKSSMPTTIHYLNGDVEAISQAIYASCCIPTLLPPVELQGENYYDGGLISASPLFPLSDYLPNCLKIIYISSFNMEEGTADMVDCSNIVQIGIGSIAETVTGLCMADKIFAVRLVMRCDKAHFTYLEDIEKALEIYKRADKALLEIFPRKDLQVDITNFDQKITLEIIKEIKQNYGLRLWWID